MFISDVPLMLHCIYKHLQCMSLDFMRYVS